MSTTHSSKYCINKLFSEPIILFHMHIRADSFSMDDMDIDNLNLCPGPRVSSVLHLQAEHRSTNIWKAGGGDSQRSRVCNKFLPLHSRMYPILRDARFDGVARLTGIHIDWSLVTALVHSTCPPESALLLYKM